MLLHIAGVVLGRFPLVDRVKVRSGFVGFQRRHEQPQRIFYAALGELDGSIIRSYDVLTIDGLSSAKEIPHVYGQSLARETPHVHGAWR